MPTKMFYQPKALIYLPITDLRFGLRTENQNGKLCWIFRSVESMYCFVNVKMCVKCLYAAVILWIFVFLW